MKNVWRFVWVPFEIILIAVLVFGGYRCGSNSRSEEVTDLLAKASESEKTIEVKGGLYATTLVQLDGVKRLLESKDASIATLRRQLDDTGAQVLTTEKLVVRWKQAYGSTVEATQTSVPITDSPPRKRVDFKHDFGPFLVIGHTLTDPGEGFVSVTQGRPLSLTLAIARNGDGVWMSYVTSSEPGMAVDVTLGAVDPGIFRVPWHRRIWLTGSVIALPTAGASLGIEYRGDRFSLGPNCQGWRDGWGCGLSLGMRIFN